MAYIGIDFGTSNSVAANFQYGQAEVLPNHEGQKWTTSVVTLRRDGTLAFLEVNPRLAVAHPVSEEVAGLDLVRETFRIAAGEPLGYGDPVARGHAVKPPRRRADHDQG